jgi:hypothetical protein
MSRGLASGLCVSFAGLIFLFNLADQAGLLSEGETNLSQLAQAQTSELTPDTCKQLLDQSNKEKDLLKKQKLKNDWKTCVNKNCPKTPKATAAKGGLECSKNAACQAFCEENRTGGKIDCCKGGPQEKPACLNRVEGKCISDTPEKKDPQKKEEQPKQKTPQEEEKERADNIIKSWKYLSECNRTKTCPYGTRDDMDLAFMNLENEEKRMEKESPREFKKLDNGMYTAAEKIREERGLPHPTLDPDFLARVQRISDVSEKLPVKLPNSPPNASDFRLAGNGSQGAQNTGWNGLPVSENIEDNRYERPAVERWIESGLNGMRHLVWDFFDLFR